MKRIYDPSFRYTPSYETDVRKTFERIRRERTAGEPSARAQAADANVLRLLQPRKTASE
jgi:hypothetical protein